MTRLELLSVQYKLKQLNEKISLIHKNIDLLMQSLKNSSTRMIKDRALVQWIDPALCAITMNKKEHQVITSKQDSIVVNEYSSSQQFSIKYDSVKPFNKFFSIYSGQLLAEAGADTSVRIYPAETLRRISRDGKFFEDHLLFTIKVQTMLHLQYPDLFVKVQGFYSRKVGMDPKDRDLYVFYEVLSSDWVCLRDFINSTGGLVRIPFLVTSNSIFHVIKYWFQKVLTIVDVCNQNGLSLYLLRPDNIFVNHKTLEVKLMTLSGAARISHEGTLNNLSDLNLILPGQPLSDDANLGYKEEHFMADPYLAPEFFYSEVTERTPYTDSWSLGALLYFLIFGEDPKSLWSNMTRTQDTKYTKEPSEYYSYDIFDDRLVNDILQHDFGIKLRSADKLIQRSIKKQSFEGVFQQVAETYSPSVDRSQEVNANYNLGSFLDLVHLLMTWKPHERPTAKALLYSKLFKSDKYQDMQMRQFSSLSFFYRSPSKCVRADVLLPLRAICATLINKPKKALGFTADLMRLIERVQACTTLPDSQVFQNLQEEFSKSKNPEELLSHSLLDSISVRVKQSENKRLKLPNYALIKFIFENHVMDLLLFAILRHHTTVNEALAVDEIPAQNLEEHYYRPVKGFAAVLKKMIFDLNSYDSACAPFVSNIIDLLVKFTVGEEFFLASDIIDTLESDSSITVQQNSLEEYLELTKQVSLLSHRRFFSNSSVEPDFLDRSWAEHMSRKPYCFWSNNWSFYLCTIASSLMREALGDAGLGSASHPVIMDYVKYIFKTKKKPGFDGEASIGYFNHLLKGSITKTADYFSEILILSNNIITLEDPNVGTTSLKVVVNYVMTTIKAKNIDKVRAVLDSRIVLKCINFLQTDDVHLKETILELVREATLSFNREHLYLFEQYDINSKFDLVMDLKPKSADEIQRNFGLVSHLALTSEDKMDKANYVNCVRNYFSINSKICEKYVRQICMAISVPSFFVSLATILKSNAEILRNKVHCLEIVYNITNAPFGLLRNLAHSSIDSFSTLAKIFVIQRSSKKNKVNEYLLPFSMKIFQNLIVDARRDVLKLMENTVGLRTLMREQNMVIPKKMTLAMLTALIQEVDTYFSNFNKEMVVEANKLTISRYAGSASRVRTEKLAHFEGLLKACCTRIICWLKYESSKTKEYSVGLLQDILFRFMENLKTYFENLFPYYQTSELITSCMICVSNFFETLVNLGFEYLLVDIVNTKRGIANLEWLMLQIYNINNYHQILGIHEKPEEEEKLLEFRINKIADLDERSKELLKFIQHSGCLVKYTSCRITQSSHSFLRIFMAILDLDDSKYNELLEAIKFVNFFSLLIQKQYSVLQMFIRTKTESIHVISRYVEESNLRLRIFEGLLKSSSVVFKQDLLETQTIQRIVNTLLAAKSELDVSFYRSNYKFLVFRNFLPFRAEAMSYISLIFWNKKANERIYNEFVNEIIKSNSFRSELENLRQKKNRLLKLSAFAFFSRLLQTADRHVNYLLREQGIYDAMMKEFEDDRELVPLFRETHKTLTDMESLF